jgi:hypothetical protein
MPIRLNLLAEAQAAEDLRRRDPVKRALWAAALLVALVLGWGSSLQLKAILANQALGKVGAMMNAKTNEFKKVMDAQKRISDINNRLISLHSLATNRFLNGNLLNAFQQTVVEDVQLSQINVQQSYSLVEGTKDKTNGTTVVRGRPATVTEHIVLSVEGSDSSASPGDEVSKYKDLLASNAYFSALLGRTNQWVLKSLSAPQVSPDSGRAIVLFTLEAKLPPKTR